MSDAYDPLAAKAAQVQAPAAAAYDPLSVVASGGTLPQDSGGTLSTFESDVARPVGLAARAIVTGVGALPLMAMDAGVATRNILGDWGRKELGWQPTPDYELPSKEFQDALTEVGFPTPKTPIEKWTSLIESAMAGAAMPVPEVGGDVPENFQTLEQVQQQALMTRRLQGVRNGMEAGYRVPPATTNPTLVNQGLETIAGKMATQQAASHLNQEVTNRLAAQAVGLDQNVPLTEEALHAVRDSASNDYNAISKAGPIKLGPDFKSAVQEIVGRFNKTAQEVPSLANKDLQPVADDLLGKDSLSGDALLGAVRGLRDKADVAFRSGDSSTGSAYSAMSRELENAAERDLSSRGGKFADLVKNFKRARQTIAMTHTIEDAMNPGTGNVVASKLAAALRRGEPLSGNLRTIAEFAASVPKAVQEPLTSPISHLNLVGEMLGGMSGAAVHGPLGAAVGTVAYPAARMGSKAFLLGAGQKFAVPAGEEAAAALPWWLRAIPGAYEGGNQ